jgi:hypothetical protein
MMATRKSTTPASKKGTKTTGTASKTTSKASMTATATEPSTAMPTINGEVETAPTMPTIQDSTPATTEYTGTEYNGNGLNEDQVRRRAYEIYLERGAVIGDPLEDWARAERELREGVIS